jgi:hypothetical protein
VDTIKLWPEEVYETGLNVITAGTPIPQRESLSPRVKSLNYLAHIMAKVEGIYRTLFLCASALTALMMLLMMRGMGHDGASGDRKDQADHHTQPPGT